MKDKQHPKLEYPTDTPWGPPQQVDVIADGIVRIHTAGHGGYWLSPERNKQVPRNLREKTFCQNGLDGWYEEDCDAAIVEAVFYKLMPGPNRLESNHQYLKDLRDWLAAAKCTDAQIDEAFGVEGISKKLRNHK